MTSFRFSVSCMGRCFAVLILILFSFSAVTAQRVMLKTNALYWATLSPNLGAEFRLSRRFTVNVEAATNPFTVSDYKLYATAFMPEVRFWPAGRPQARHFIGAMALGAIYDLHYDGTSHDGNAVGAGLTYGYCFVLGKRWSLETTLGAGLLRFREKKTPDGQPVSEVPNHSKTIFAPLKAGITLTYILK